MGEAQGKDPEQRVEDALAMNLGIVCEHGWKFERDAYQRAFILQHGENREARLTILDRELVVEDKDYGRRMVAEWIDRVHEFERTAVPVTGAADADKS